MLLPPFNPQELATFRLTSLERGLKRDLLFTSDLGIALNSLDIERFSVPSTRDQLDPEDEALLRDETSGHAAPVNVGPVRPRGRREGAADVSWLLRTKYITNEVGGAGARARRDKSTGFTAEKLQEPEVTGVPQDELASQITAIEATFEAARRPPKHPKNPNAIPVEILPVLPDELIKDWSLVLATFDGDPTADVDRFARMASEERARAVQAAQLKSFVRRKTDGSQDRFVALLLPMVVKKRTGIEAGDGQDVVVPAKDLCGEYDWTREYDSQVRYDDRGQTYLFRITKDHIGYADLNTRLGLRKRKRIASSGGDDEDAFLQPEKFIIQMPLEEEPGVAPNGKHGAAPIPAVSPAADTSDAKEGGGALAETLRNVFGSDDDE